MNWGLRHRIGLGAAAAAILGLLTATAHATTVGDLSRVTARAAIVVDHKTGKVLFARNASMPLPPASTTKLVTALVAIQSGAMDSNVNVSRRASRMQPSKIWLKQGWSMNVRDLVYAMLLRSANDASVAIAEGLGGSTTKFARKMNATVKKIGAKSSHFVNPNGLPARGHYSSAADLAVIVSHALAQPEMRQILSTRNKRIRPRSGSRRNIQLRTTNKLLGKKPYQLIGKTGYTRKAKRCFAGAASLAGNEVLVVVLGSNDLWKDLELLVDFGLQPSTPPKEWKGDTGWRQAKLPGEQRSSIVTKVPSAKLPTESSPPPPPKPVAQGDRGRVLEQPTFRYHVQVASLRSQTIAEDLAKQVAAQGYNVAIEARRADGTDYYRVLVKDLADRVIARRIARELSRELRLETQIIAIRG